MRQLADEPLPKPPGALRRALTAWLLGGAPPKVARRIHAAMRRDDAWSAWYDALRRIERANRPAALGTGQRELLESLVLDASAAPRAAVGDPHAITRSPAWPALAAASLSLALFVSLGAEPVDEPRATLTPRALSAEVPLVGVRARCFDVSQTRVLAEAEAGPQDPADRLACPDDGLLAFSLTNLSSEPQYVFVVGVTRSGALRWYAPFDREASATRVEPGTVDAALGVAASLASLPGDERVTLYALFSPHPLTARELFARLSTAQQRGSLSSALERLPLDVEHQAHIELVRGGP